MAGRGPGGRALLLHRAAARREELRIEAASVLGELDRIDQCGQQVVAEAEAAVEQVEQDRSTFCGSSSRLTVLDDRVTVVRALLGRLGTAPTLAPCRRAGRGGGDVLLERVEEKLAEVRQGVEALVAEVTMVRERLERLVEGVTVPGELCSGEELVVVHDRVVKEVEERREEVLRVWEVVVTWEEVAADEVAGEQVVGYITVTSVP